MSLQPIELDVRVIPPREKAPDDRPHLRHSRQRPVTGDPERSRSQAAALSACHRASGELRLDVRSGGSRALEGANQSPLNDRGAASSVRTSVGRWIAVCGAGSDPSGNAASVRVDLREAAPLLAPRRILHIDQPPAQWESPSCTARSGIYGDICHT